MPTLIVQDEDLAVPESLQEQIRVVLGGRDGAGLGTTVVRNPWRGARMQERMGIAYRGAQQVLEAAGADRSVARTHWEAVLHEWIYFFFEDVVAGGLDAAVLRDVPLGTEMNVIAKPGLSGDVFAASLAERTTVVRPTETESSSGSSRSLPWPTRRPRISGADVLIVEVYGNRLSAHEQLIRRLRERQLRVAVLSLATRPVERDRLRQFCAEQSLEFHEWTAFVGPRVVASVLGSAARLAPCLPRLAHRLREHPDLPDPVRRRIAIAGCKRLGTSVLRIALLAEVMREAFNAWSPSVVLTARGDDSIVRVMGRVGETLKIPVVDLQHGLRAGCGPELNRDIPWVQIAVAGRGAYDAYRAAGIPPARLHITGTTIYDELVDKAPPSFLPGAPYVVYSSAAVRVHKRMSAIASHVAIVGALDDLLDTAPELHVVIKPHPQEYHGATEELAVDCRNSARIQVARGAPNLNLFAGAEAHVSIGSTTAIEAVLLGVRSIYVNLTDFTRALDKAIELGAVIEERRIEDLAETINRVRSSRVSAEARTQLIEYYAYRLDGQTVDRVLQIPAVRDSLENAAQ